jgi:hypothetical protein
MEQENIMDLMTTCHLVDGLVGHSIVQPQTKGSLPKASKAILLGRMGHGKSLFTY